MTFAGMSKCVFIADEVSFSEDSMEIFFRIAFAKTKSKAKLPASLTLRCKRRKLGLAAICTSPVQSMPT
ncbi:hypothetical protein Plhal304r1_c024g0083131 [Plasmopara halstedii]